jgi:hypothetical protein
MLIRVVFSFLPSSHFFQAKRRLMDFSCSISLRLGSAATPDPSFLPIPHSNRAVIPRVLDAALIRAFLVAHPMRNRTRCMYGFKYRFSRCLATTIDVPQNQKFLVLSSFLFFLFLFGTAAGSLFASYYRIMIGVCLFRGWWAVRERVIFPGITNTTLGTKRYYLWSLPIRPCASNRPRRSQHILRRPSRFKYVQQALALSALRLRSYRS